MTGWQPAGSTPWSGWLLSLLLALPWLQPWAPGPEPNTVPLLVSWGALATVLALGRWPDARTLAKAWAVAAVLSSLIGLLQYFGQAAALSGWVHVPAGAGEAMGNLRQRNQLATLIGIGAVAVLWWQAQGLRRGHALWMLAVLALGHAATGSRTGLLQWLVLLPALLVLWRVCQGPASAAQRWSWPLLLWAMGLDLLAGWLLPEVLNGWTGASASSALARMSESHGCGSRAVLWANVWHLVLQKPWLGWGWGELKYAHYMTSYSGPRFCEILGNAHNLPLHLAFVFGLPLTLGLGAGVLALLLRAKPWRLQGPADSLAWGAVAMIGLHSLLEFPLWYGPFQLAALGALLLLWPQASAWLQQRMFLLRAAGLAGLALVVLLGVDYARVRQIYLPAAQRLTLWRDDAWQVAQQTCCFERAVEFAVFTSTPVTADNAQVQLQRGLAVLHYSPEPRVIDRLIESARLSGQDALADWHQRQRALVYPGR